MIYEKQDGRNNEHVLKNQPQIKNVHVQYFG